MIVQSLVPPRPFYYRAFSSSTITTIQLWQRSQRNRFTQPLHSVTGKTDEQWRRIHMVWTPCPLKPPTRDQNCHLGESYDWYVSNNKSKLDGVRQEPNAGSTHTSRLLGTTADTQPLRVPWTYTHFVPHFLFLRCPAFAIILVNEEDYMSFPL